MELVSNLYNHFHKSERKLAKDDPFKLYVISTLAGAFTFAYTDYYYNSANIRRFSKGVEMSSMIMNNALRMSYLGAIVGCFMGSISHAFPGTITAFVSCNAVMAAMMMPIVILEKMRCGGCGNLHR